MAQAPPTSVAATGSSSSTIQLTWVAAPGALTYNLYRGTAPDHQLIFPVATLITGTIYQDFGLQIGQTYYYRMTALGAVDQSVVSNETSATPGPGGGSGSVTVVNSGDGLTGGPITSTGALSLDLDDAHTWEAPQAFAGGVAFWAATPQDQQVLSLGSSTDDVITFLQSLGLCLESSFLPPTLVSATPGGDGTISLTWVEAVGADTYNLYRGLTSGSEVLVTTGLTGTSHDDTGLVNGTTYFYKMKSVGDDGLSGFSNETSAIAGPLVVSTVYFHLGASIPSPAPDNGVGYPLGAL